MKLLLLGLFLLLASPEQESGSIVPIFGNKGNGHACSIEGTIYTAGHNNRGADRGYYWSDQYGQEGVLKATIQTDPRDLLLLTVVRGDTPKWYKRGATPKLGDKIYWYGYSQDPKDGYASTRKTEAKVTGLSGGHIFFDARPLPGDSGTCILNAEGEAVGIVNFSFQLQAGKLVSGGVDLSKKE